MDYTNMNKLYILGYYDIVCTKDNLSY